MPPYSRRRPAPFRRRKSSAAQWASVVPAAPSAAASPFPANGDGNAYWYLSWAAAGGARYDVYLDTAYPPLALASVHQVAPTYALPQGLAPGTWYWKIVAFNDGGSAVGPVWSFVVVSPTRMMMTVAGQRFEGHYRYGTLGIHNAFAALPDTGSLVFDQRVNGGEGIRIGLGGLDAPHLIFGGEIQTPTQDFDESLSNKKWPTQIVDYTFELNKTRPFGSWTNVSASDVVREIVLPPFTANGVQDDLPFVSIIFDGQSDFMTCLNALATAISDTLNIATADVGYDRDVSLGFAIPADGPTKLDAFNLTLQRTPNIKITTDLSQLRTLFRGRGHGENVPCDVPAGEFILPIDDAVMFNPNGGLCVAGETSGGAQFERMPYAGIQLGGAGTLLGPGVGPSAAPTLIAVSGTALAAGTYRGAYTFVTGIGESQPSPAAYVTLGDVPDPQAGDAPTPSNDTSTWSTQGYGAIGDTLQVGITFDGGYGVNRSAIMPGGSIVIAATNPVWGVHPCVQTFTATITRPSILVAYFSIWVRVNGGAWIEVTRENIQSNSTPIGVPVNIGLRYLLNTGSFGGPLPAPDRTMRSIAATNIAVGPTQVTNRKYYRSAVNAFQLQLHTTIANNTATAIANDTKADGALGANAPLGDASGLPQVAGQINGGSPVLLVASAAPFQPNGGWAAAGPNFIRYAGIGGQEAPTAGPTVAAAAGSGMDPGVHGYAVTFVTAQGESLPSPVVFVTTGGSNNNATVTNVPIGPTGTTARNYYRTFANQAQLKFLGQLPGNILTTGGVPDTIPDNSLGANAPTRDTSGLDARSFLLGVPAFGPGAMTTTMNYGQQVTPVPALVGINAWNGLRIPIAKGSAVHIFVERNNLGAQSILSQIELDENGNTTSGIHEDLFVDERFGEQLLIQTCDALLAKYSKVILRADYYTYDQLTKSGRIVLIDSAWCGFGTDTDAPFLIQDVQLGQIDTIAGVYPLRKVVASSVLFTVQNLLQGVKIGRT